MSAGALAEMRKRTLRLGLNAMAAGVILITLVTFYHETIASILSFTPEEDSRLIYLGLFWGGACGGVGVLLSAAGFLLGSSNARDRGVNLVPALILLFGGMVLFGILFYSSINEPAEKKLLPGESITI